MAPKWSGFQGRAPALTTSQMSWGWLGTDSKTVPPRLARYTAVSTCYTAIPKGRHGALRRAALSRLAISLTPFRQLWSIYFNYTTSGRVFGRSSTTMSLVVQTSQLYPQGAASMLMGMQGFTPPIFSSGP